MWTSLKLQRDGHVTFERAYDSAPCRLVGQRLQVCGGLEHVRIFTADYQLVAIHDRVPDNGKPIPTICRRRSCRG